MADEFAKSPIASFHPDAGTIVTFPIKSVQENGGLRLTPRERLFRPGAKQDSTGVSPKGWTTMSHFFNQMSDPSVRANNAPYPQTLNDLLAAGALGVGTLVLPTTGPVRAKLHTYTRVEGDERTDFATLTVVWAEDNEDGQTLTSFLQPVARSAAVPLAVQVQAQLAAEGIWSADVSLLGELAAALQAALLQPSAYADDAEQAASALSEAISRIQTTFGSATFGSPASGLLLAPASFGAGLGLTALAEMAARSRASAAGTTGPVPVRYKQAVSLAFVAADKGQALDDLANLNASLPDLRRIPAGTPILVRRSDARAA